MPWRLPDSPADRLALAKGYPFAAPGGCYLFRDGVARPLPRDPTVLAGRRPVLAHGSNRSPEQLARKFGSDAEIPVTYGHLADYDVVYSAHMSQYGSIPSTLYHSPGTAARIAVNWLDAEQLARMHETEGPSAYAYGRMAGVSLRLESGPDEALSEATVYLSTNGCLAAEPGSRSPIGLGAVQAEGRRHPALDQGGVLELVRARYRPNLTLDDMILRKVADPDKRKALVADMKARAVAPPRPHFEEIERPVPTKRPVF